MYVNKSEAIELLQQNHGNLFDKIDKKTEVLFQIAEENDWSFVIKTHAYIEAIVTETILVQIDDDRLKPTIERLPLSDEKIGKIKIAKDLDLFDEDERKFIKLFSNLRNNVAHRIDNIDFSFKNHIESLDKNQKKSWANTISWYAKDDSKEYYQQQAIASPKMVILIGVFIMSGLKVLKGFELTSLRQLDDLAKKTTASLVEKIA